VGNKNPDPTYKPVTASGTPTLSSGGGGYYTGGRGPTFSGTGSLIAAGAGGFLLGSFLYGGSHRSPSCGGGYGYGYNNGCNYGSSSQKHQCTAQIPLCSILETIRAQWYVGSKTNLELQKDKSTCSITIDFLPPPLVDGNATAAAANMTLADCMNRVVLDGSCSAKRFVYDNVNNVCGCCAAGSAFSATDFFSSAIYGYDTSSGFQAFGAPTHCISGSTMFWPKKSNSTVAVTDATLSGGGSFTDERYSCSCGICNECGSPDVKYLDWGGPFTVADAVGELDAVESKNKYDPVDTCKCGESSASCPAVNGSSGTTAQPSSFFMTCGLMLISSTMGLRRVFV